MKNIFLLITCGVLIHSISCTKMDQSFQEEQAESQPSKAQVVSDLLQQISRRSKGDSIRWNALNELARMGPDAAEAVPMLIKIAEDPNETSRSHVIETLGYIGVPTSDIVSALARILKSADNKYIIRESARALGRIGSSANTAVSTLITVGNSDSMLVFYERDTIAEALGHIGPKAKESIPLLVSYMKDRSYGEVRIAAAIAVLRIDPNGQIADDAMSILIDDLERNLPFDQRPWLAEQLGTLGPVARAALPALERVANLDRKDIRSAASAAIIKIREQLQEEQKVPNKPIEGN
jgi:HEAT repeat protein